jgi:hypothetical protein
MTDNFSIVSPEALNTINGGSTYTLDDLITVTEFQLKLGDGSTVEIPCTEMKMMHFNGSTLVAGALHHLIQRVAALEAVQAHAEGRNK